MSFCICSGSFFPLIVSIIIDRTEDGKVICAKLLNLSLDQISSLDFLWSSGSSAPLHLFNSTCTTLILLTY